MCCCTASATDLRDLFLLAGVFCLILLPTFAKVPQVLWIWENFFYPETFFNLHSFPTFGTTCFYHGFPGSRHFFHEGCRASHWGSKHRSSPYLCLNHIMLSKKYYLVGSIFVLQTQPISLSEPHNVKQKVLLGRFYFCIKVLQNAVSTSSRLWNHSLIATYIARYMSYLLSYRSS